MIRMIASDLDGTLLTEGTFDLNPEYYDVIKQLTQKGILFVAASGRHISSIRRMFRSLEEDVIFMAGNGSLAMYRGEVIALKPVDHGLFHEALGLMREVKPCLILVDHPECTWTDSDREDLQAWLRDGYKVTLKKCQDIAQLEAPVLKLAMYLDHGTVREAERLRNHFGASLNIMKAGANWVDVVSPLADKASALEMLQKRFGVSREETIAFGDNDNDISMLKLAGHSYAVENAREGVRLAADEVIGPMSEDAVLGVLKSLL